MDRNINILHLSDLHMKKDNLVDIGIRLDALIDDIERLNKDINFICFTGDLIWSGEKEDIQFELAFDEFIEPLLKKLDLSRKNFFFNSR